MGRRLAAGEDRNLGELTPETDPAQQNLELGAVGSRVGTGPCPPSRVLPQDAPDHLDVAGLVASCSWRRCGDEVEVDPAVLVRQEVAHAGRGEGTVNQLRQDEAEVAEQLETIAVAGRSSVTEPSCQPGELLLARVDVQAGEASWPRMCQRFVAEPGGVEVEHGRRGLRVREGGRFALVEEPHRRSTSGCVPTKPTPGLLRCWGASTAVRPDQSCAGNEVSPAA